MHALIDADILCYEIGSMRNPDGNPLPWPLIQKLVDNKIQDIQQACEATSWQGYLTGEGNFRYDIATIQPYKGNRSATEKPFWKEAIFNYLRDERNCQVVKGYEADDQIAIDYEEDCIICSRDKDLKQIPGWHYGWAAGKQKEKAPYFVTEIQGVRNFYSQLLTGDVADNILGLFGVGENAASVKRLQTFTTEQECFQEIKLQYQLRFGSYWDMFLCENGTLLWLLRYKGDKWYDRQKELLRQFREADSQSEEAGSRTTEVVEE